MKLIKEKVKLRKTKVLNMGHVLTEKGLGVGPAKVETIRCMPTPDDKQGVQHLLGVVNYVQKFAPMLADVTAPLGELTHDNVEFLWEENVHGKVFRELKRIFSEAPVLSYFDAKLPTVLQWDASEKGIRACLLQDGHPVAYASRSLTTSVIA